LSKVPNNSAKIPTPYNPLSKEHLGESVVKSLLRTPVSLLPPEPFLGAGVYVIYYTGDFPIYSRIASYNRNNKYRWPIYVGKAVPVGARKGASDPDPGPDLHKRLSEHATSISQAKNLDLKDFACRFLVVDDIWIPLTESILIESFQPVWNQSLDGFGNHAPGSGREKQKQSPWDALHPGRSWATQLPKAALSVLEIEQRTESFIKSVQLHISKAFLE
jgi:hypothetical protein